MKNKKVMTKRNLLFSPPSYLIIVVHSTGLTILWICIIALAITLHRNIQTRESSLGQSKTVASQAKNIRVIKMVLLIAAVYSKDRVQCDGIFQWKRFCHWLLLSLVHEHPGMLLSLQR